MFATKPELGVGLARRAAGWKIRRRRCWATAPMVITPSCATSLTSGPAVRAVGLAGDDRVQRRDEVHSARAALGTGPAAAPVPARIATPSRSATLIARPGREAAEDGHVPRRARRQAGRSRGSCSCASAPRTTGARTTAKGAGRKAEEIPPREEWLIAEWPKGHESRPTTGSPTSRARHPARAARPTRPAALEDRARLQATQRRARPRSLRRPLLARAGITTPRWSPPRTGS